jgi:hypothetical protein
MQLMACFDTLPPCTFYQWEDPFQAFKLRAIQKRGDGQDEAASHAASRWRQAQAVESCCGRKTSALCGSPSVLLRYCTATLRSAVLTLYVIKPIEFQRGKEIYNQRDEKILLTTGLGTIS